jgi:hypothetical protein
MAADRHRQLQVTHRQQPDRRMLTGPHLVAHIAVPLDPDPVSGPQDPVPRLEAGDPSLVEIDDRCEKFHPIPILCLRVMTRNDRIAGRPTGIVG